MDCDAENLPRDGKACRFDLSQKNLGICSREYNYGYSRASPCIFLKLSNVRFLFEKYHSCLLKLYGVFPYLQIVGWTPQYLNNSMGLAADMPLELQEAINYISGYDKRYLKHEMIWITCEGENPADVENMGPINYFPNRGFYGYYFPFTNQKGYMSPMVAINFERPNSKHEHDNQLC
jgi:sodium/potassium-transporting ATPase subunit beta